MGRKSQEYNTHTHTPAPVYLALIVEPHVLRTFPIRNLHMCEESIAFIFESSDDNALEGPILVKLKVSEFISLSLSSPNVLAVLV